MLSADAFRGELIVFLAALRPEAGQVSITGQSNLFEAGILDSLAIVELIVFLEERFSVELPVENIPVESFYTLDSLYHVILDAQTAAISPSSGSDAADARLARD